MSTAKISFVVVEKTVVGLSGLILVALLEIEALKATAMMRGCVATTLVVGFGGVEEVDLRVGVVVAG